MAPVLPFSSKETVTALLDAVRDHVDSIFVDTLNIKCGNWTGIKNSLSECDAALLPKWKDIRCVGNGILENSKTLE